MPNFKFNDFSNEFGSGFMIEHKRHGVNYAVFIVCNEDGRLSAGTSKGVEAGEYRWIDLDSNAKGHWVYSALTGQPSSALLDVLGVAFADRDNLGHFFQEAHKYAEKTLPALNSAALNAMSLSPDKTLLTYHFLSDPAKQLYRQQAAASYPLFIDLLNSKLKLKMSVDRASGLAEAMIPIFSDIAGKPIQPAFLKRFQNAAQLPEGEGISSVMKFAAEVPIDWFPKNPQDWQAFYQLAYAVIDDIGLPASKVPSLVKGSQGKWTDQATRMISQLFIDPEHDAHKDPISYIRTGAIMVRDTLEACVDYVILPLAAHAQEANDVYLNTAIRSIAVEWAWDMLFEGRNLIDIYDLARRFHQERAAMIETIEQKRIREARAQIKEGGWPGLTQNVQAPNGVWLIPLLTPEELKTEGQKMSHCVGGYTHSAQTLRCHIVSVREINGTDVKWLSTCEFVGITGPNPKELHERQNQARGNTAPPSKSKDAIRWYQNQICDGSLKVNWDLMEVFRGGEALLPKGDSVERLCGYDWRDRETLNNAVMPWGGFVTKKYRMPLNQLMQCEYAQRIVQEMTPAFLTAESLGM